MHTEQFSHSENLHVFIEQVLKESNLQPKAIKAIVISAGPGSYTGLRIGVATAKGFMLWLGYTPDSLTYLAYLGRTGNL